LRCFIADQPKTWVLWISWAEYWYNTTYHSSTGKTPFEVVYGRAVPLLTRFLPGETKVEAVRRELLDRDECLRQLKHHLNRARTRMKSQADHHRTDREFAVGDWVFLKLCPHVQQSVEVRINPKLAPRYYGPYQIVEIIGLVAYKLKLPETARIYPVFHCSLLKKAIGNYEAETKLTTGLDGDSGNIWEPVDVLATRTATKAVESVTQFLIHWKGKSAVEATWEDKFIMHSQFPSFRLEDKSASHGGSIDRDSRILSQQSGPKVWKVYVRKNRK